MDGQYLNRLIEWGDSVIKSDERFVSDDIDWFVGSVPKNEWLLMGFSIAALAKTLLERKGLACPVGLCVSLNWTKRRGRIPFALTDKLLRKVDNPPTIYALRGYDDKEDFIKEERNFLTRFVKIDSGPIYSQIKGDIFYCEKKYSNEDGPCYDRFMLFLF